MSEFNICMLGPSRCGKTTLLASVVNEFMKISEEVSQKDDEYIKIEPRGATKGKINASIDGIKASTREGAFLTEALKGTVDHTVYDFDIAYQNKAEKVTDPNLRIHFHDFPGGWLIDDDPRINDVKFNEAQILIIPVDAALIFEAKRPKHIAWAEMQLQIASLLDVAKRWAEARKRDKEHPGLFILAPVKCESYFNDNLPIGLMQDNSEKLRDKITAHFGELIHAVTSISPNTRALYMPVDTIGCCYINAKDWIEAGPTGFEFVAQYQIPKGYGWTPFGPANIMLQIIQYLIDTNEENKGFWDKILDFIGWNPDLVKKVKKMQAACDKNYKRARTL